jgi:hypothetical protein
VFDIFGGSSFTPGGISAAVVRATSGEPEAVIGGFISLIGSIWTLAVIICANNYAINGWSTPSGKFLTQIAESNLMLWFCISIELVILGIILMVIEYFKKDS